ncbi:MAG: type II toxin-antitoxin system RatA family toxin [Gammaproteobacteria bacterium]|nr:type II toxin-antitoxin system RatA family toxin [Gammaproteobacteria bacterium]
MRHVLRTALLPYSAAQMYALVNDVKAYPDFLPWCRSTRVLDSSPTHMRAQIEMSLAGLTRSFTTHNALAPPERIDLALVDGPFRHLEGHWRFEALTADACKVHLDLSFEVANALFSMALSPAFEKISSSLVDAFSQRAHQVYGSA